jgi:hypothetical protein
MANHSHRALAADCAARAHSGAIAFALLFRKSGGASNVPVGFGARRRQDVGPYRGQRILEQQDGADRTAPGVKRPDLTMMAVGLDLARQGDHEVATIGPTLA